MKILAIETATIVCGAAVVMDGALVSEEQIQQKNVHAESIMGLIDTALKHSRVALDELDAVAISIGPGSFTGLRIGLSVAKGLCFALGMPLVAVPTLQALAQRAVDADVDVSPFVLSALDARRDEVYCQLFAVNGKSMQPVWEERDLSLTRLFEEIGERPVTITGDANTKLQLKSHSGAYKFVSDKFSTCSAASVGLIGARMAMQGEFVDARTIEPKYIKNFYLKLPT